MTLKDPKKIIRNLFDKHATKMDNVVYAEKLFIINTIVNYLFRDKHYTEIDKKELMEYGEVINKFLKNEVDIFWKDGKLMVQDEGRHS
jgi:hypothetical protein